MDVNVVLDQLDDIIWPEVSHLLNPIDRYLDGVQKTSFEDIERELMDRFNVPIFEPLPFTKDDLQRYSLLRSRAYKVIQNQTPEMKAEIVNFFAVNGGMPYLLRSCF